MWGEFALPTYTVKNLMRPRPGRMRPSSDARKKQIKFRDLAAPLPKCWYSTTSGICRCSDIGDSPNLWVNPGIMRPL
eukprot:1137971-Pelagomonas_calceolata.AAC.2